MALIYNNNDASTPQTHALVIGVGGYRYLAGGVEEKPELIQRIGLLEQLTSPPRSAFAFSEMLREMAANLQAPLGTVDLLISTPPRDDFQLPGGMPSQLPTIDNIQGAYDAWRTRCEQHKDNIAIFYFCGHGLEKEEQILLAEDFGTSLRNPWDGSFAFDSTRLAFQSCPAMTQCFFIDACRQITSSMLTHSVTVAPLDDPDLTAPELAANLTIKGAARSLTSMGPPRGIAYFTQALIRALKGAAAESPGNYRWVVKSNNVAAKMQVIMGMVNPSENFAQRCHSDVTGEATLMKVGTPPVELELACQPSEANDHAELICSRLDPPGFPETQHQGAPWLLEVEPGFYIAEARFKEGNYSDANSRFWVSPPRISPPLECWP